LLEIIYFTSPTLAESLGMGGRGVVAPSKCDGPEQAVWALRITARDRYSDRCWGWGEPLSMSLEGAVIALERFHEGDIVPDEITG
jgi:hypothetical protein